MVGSDVGVGDGHGVQVGGGVEVGDGMTDGGVGSGGGYGVDGGVSHSGYAGSACVGNGVGIKVIGTEVMEAPGDTVDVVCLGPVKGTEVQAMRNRSEKAHQMRCLNSIVTSTSIMATVRSTPKCVPQRPRPSIGHRLTKPLRDVVQPGRAPRPSLGAKALG